MRVKQPSRDPYFSHQIQESTLVAVQKESQSLRRRTPADQSESVPTLFFPDDFVLLTKARRIAPHALEIP